MKLMSDIENRVTVSAIQSLFVAVSRCEMTTLELKIHSLVTGEPLSDEAKVRAKKNSFRVLNGIYDDS